MEIKYKRPKRLIYLAMSLVLFLFVGSIYLVLYLSDDAGGITEVTVTNVTSSAASISWVTDRYSRGSVIYGKDNNYKLLFMGKDGKTESFDDRDIKQDNEGRYILKKLGERERKTHHVTLHKLNPNTTYYFRIGNGKRFFEEKVMSFRTGSIVEELRTPDPVYGIVKNFERSGPEPTEGIVYYQLFKKDEATIVSKLYSTTLNGANYSWTGDLGFVTDENGNLFHWDNSFYIRVTVKTEVGSGYRAYSLNQYKPLDINYINFRYNPEI